MLSKNQMGESQSKEAWNIVEDLKTNNTSRKFVKNAEILK